MSARLFVVHGSHPCATVEKALELKGIDHRRVELPAATQPLVMTPLFGGRTVPGIRFDDGTKIQGSRAILRELERRVPEPALYGTPEIDEAERWGDEVLQPIVRRLLWAGFTAQPQAMHGYQAGGRLPGLPMPAVLAAAKVVLPVERRLNAVTDDAVAADLRALPGHFDRIDAWIAGGVLGAERPNAADLQIATSVRLLHTLEDLRPLLAGRPAEALAFRWFAPLPGRVPAGALDVPADATAQATPAR
jgi:glutathione S-transferase